MSSSPFTPVALPGGVVDFGCDAPDSCGAAPGVPCDPTCPGAATDPDFDLGEWLAEWFPGRV